jgi:hypothetical protein
VVLARCGMLEAGKMLKFILHACGERRRHRLDFLSLVQCAAK